MSPMSMVSYGPSQKLHPLSLLAQLTSRFTSGCLQVSDGSTSWLVYFDQGKLAFVTNLDKPFERLDRHLRQLSRQVPALVSAVRVQVRLLFDTGFESPAIASNDYRAIHWLAEQQYLTPTQAAALIEGLAKEVLESLLALTEGSYELIDKEKFSDYPKLCQLDLRPVVEHCQNQLRRRQVNARQAFLPSAKPDTFEQKDDRWFPGGNSLPEPPQLAQAPTSKVNPSWNSRIDSAKAKNDSTIVAEGHYTIACIDDSPTILQAIKSFLDDASFTVIMINDPIKALMQIIRNKPDIILLDVGMPNLDGYELCSLLRRHANFKNTPIIMVTGNTGFIDRAKARLVGASGYLAKPFTQSELLKTVFKHLV
ncbi:MAG: response regulator [Kovacikia sp.]